MGGKFGIGVLATALIALAAANPSALAQSNQEGAQPPAVQPPVAQTPATPPSAGQTPAPEPPAGQTPVPEPPAAQPSAAQTPVPQTPPPQTPPPQTPPPQAPASQIPNPPVTPGSGGVGSPSVTVLNTGEVQGILGREVRSAADEDMGRIVDVIVDGEGRARAAIIDFGGFLGVGSRKIAVDWKALHFVPTASKPYGVVLELTRDQVKPAPEYKEGKPIIVLGASGALQPFP